MEAYESKFMYLSAIQFIKDVSCLRAQTDRRMPLITRTLAAGEIERSIRGALTYLARFVLAAELGPSARRTGGHVQGRGAMQAACSAGM